MYNYLTGTSTTPINYNPQYDWKDPAVQRALTIMQQNQDAKLRQDSKNRVIQRLFEYGFEIRGFEIPYGPVGPQKLTSKMLQQAIWRTANRLKPLDFETFGAPRPKINEEIVRACVRSVMDHGYYANTLRDKGGVFFKMLMYGDAWFQIGSNPDAKPENPIKFQVLNNQNVFFDSYATWMRNGSYGQKVTNMTVIRSMSWDMACREFPKIKKLATVGKIPRQDVNSLKELDRSYYQKAELLTDYMEIAWNYDIINKTYTIFAGPTCAVIDKYESAEYPFMVDEEPYIPVIHHLCFPSSEGFYNHGLGDTLYDLAILTRRMMNAGIGHVEENTWPMTLVNVPKGEAGKFFQTLAAAYDMRATGKRGYVPVEYDVDNPNSNRLQTQSLINQGLLQEWQILLERLDKEIRRLGLNLDDAQYDSTTTATQIIAESESSDSLVKQMQEYNASEELFTVRVVLDLIGKLIKKSNDTPVDFMTSLEDEEGNEVDLRKITYGAVSDEVRKNKYFVVINSRTGAIPSNVLEQTYLTRALSIVPPGTKAWAQTASKLLKLSGQNIGIKDLMGGGASQQIPDESSAPSQTDRIKINPTAKKDPLAAI